MADENRDVSEDIRLQIDDDALDVFFDPESGSMQEKPPEEA